MTWIILLVMGMLVAILLLINWVWRLADNHHWLQVNYIELLGMVQREQEINRIQAQTIEQLEQSIDSRVRASARAASQDVDNAAERARIIMYQVSAHEALMPKGQRPRALYE